MVSRENIERWVAELDEDGMCDISDNQVAALIRGYNSMAVQLANAESKCRELAAENAALKNPDNWLSQSDYGYEASEVATQNGATDDESLRAGMIAIINRIETPATDAFMAEVRASAIRDALDDSSDYLDTDCVMDRLDISYEDAELRTSGAIELHDALVAVANQLRKGE